MRRRLRFLLVLLALMGHTVLMAQGKISAIIDSLLKILPLAKEDTGKVNLLNSLSYDYSYNNPDEGIKYGQLAMQLATQIDWQNGIAIANNNIGVNYYKKSDCSTALGYYNSALEKYEKTDNKRGISSVLGNIGNVYFLQNELATALDYYLKELKIDEEVNNKKGIANANGNIGNVYMSQNNYTKAIDYYSKQMQIDEQTGNKMELANVIGNIGSVYQLQSNYPKALEYYFKTLKTEEELGNDEGIEVSNGNIGAAYAAQKNYALALEYEQRALKKAEEIEDKYGIALNLCSIGSTYLSFYKDTPRHEKALAGSDQSILSRSIDYLQKSIIISKEIMAQDVLKDCNKNLSDVFYIKGDFRNAFDYYKNYVAIKDSLFSKQYNEKITALEMNRDYDMKIAEIKKITALKLQRLQTYTIIGIVGIIFLSGFIFFIVRERKKSEKLLLNILPSEVASELKSKGIVKAKKFDDVTILFTDFVNFTSASERLAPEELIDELHVCFKVFDEITEKHNVEKIKTIGDAYLAVCGLPEPNRNHAENVVKAAVEINKFMQERTVKIGEKAFSIRIGIHTGSIIAGIVGVKKFSYDIWGDSVNIAARIEQNSEPGKINISQTTYEHVKNKFTCLYRGEIEAKNKGRMKMYFIT